MPSGWLAITIEAARRAVAGEAIAGVVPATVVALAEGVIQAMKLQRLQTIGAAAALILGLAVGAGAVAQGVGDRKGEAPKAGESAGAPPVPEPSKGRAIAPEDRKKDPVIGDEARHRAILAQLEEPLTMSFPQDIPLEELLKYIKQGTQSKMLDLPAGIPIYVDPIGLQEAEKTLQSTVALDLEGVPLKRSLFLALKQLGLTYHVVDGLLIITSADSDDPSQFSPEPAGPSPMKLIGAQGPARRDESRRAEGVPRAPQGPQGHPQGPPRDRRRSDAPRHEHRACPAR